MKRSSFVAAFGLLALIVGMAIAADVNGKWVGEYTTPDGQTRQTTFTFQVSGETLTGTVAGARGESQIQDGKVAGDQISFQVIRNFGGNDMKFVYKGKVTGDQIAFNVVVGDGERTFDITAKRAK